MFIKLVILLCVIGVIKAYYNNDLRVIDSIENEPTCTSQGGICTIAKDCPALVEQKGLCPNQQSRGVECCYGISERETRCRKRGGECMEGCNNPENRATDCPKQTSCCILLK